MNLTSLLMPQKPNTLKARNHDFLRSSYYGSIGRPDRSVKRRSAVELLQESKAFYVKSESVLDARQELKNAEQFHVRSPTRVEVVSTLPRRGGGHHCLPLSCYSICPTCYPHSIATNKDHLHLDHFQLQTLQEHYLLHYERLQRDSRDALRNCGVQQSSKGDRKLRRSSVPTESTFKMHSLPVERRPFEHSMTSAFATVETFPPWTTAVDPPPLPLSPKTMNHISGNDRLSPVLPPKGTRLKPVRPHDFPQRLKSQEGSPELTLIQPPPPPPRRNSDHHVQDVHSKLRRLIRDRPSTKTKFPVALPVTLPSPILPSAPSTDVIMESPMSDGPIISPPPAFSTPVTPMIDRQNSSASEKSNQRLPLLFSATTSAAMSVISASSGKSRKSAVIENGSGIGSSDVSMRNSTSGSTSTPLSKSTGERTGVTEDEDSSKICAPPRTSSRGLASKKVAMTKSITENALSRVASFDSGIVGRAEMGLQARQHSISSQTEELPRIVASPVRRPILRSKSDLSHRYKKSSSAAQLLRGSGFTLVPVDFGSSSICGPFVEPKYSTTDSRRLDSRRASRSSVDLERFFDKMGLDSAENSPTHLMPLKFNNDKRSSDSSPIFFSSMSSIDSIARREGSIDSAESREQRYVAFGRCGYGYNGGIEPGGQVSLMVPHGEPSIVERNARVIKWLFNCRKAVETTRLRR